MDDPKAVSMDDPKAVTMAGPKADSTVAKMEMKMAALLVAQTVDQ